MKTERTAFFKDKVTADIETKLVKAVTDYDKKYLKGVDEIMTKIEMGSTPAEAIKDVFPERSLVNVCLKALGLPLYTASLVEQLDCIASELEHLDPRLSLALDKIADQLENTFSDASLKSKLQAITRKYSGRYSDDSWKELTAMLKEFHTVLPSITMVENTYKHDEKHNPNGKEWIYVGAFKNKETPRAVWIQVTASGIGSVADPLEKYELNTVIETLSPKNLKSKAKEVYDTLVTP